MAFWEPARVGGVGGALQPCPVGSPEPLVLDCRLADCAQLEAEVVTLGVFDVLQIDYLP